MANITLKQIKKLREKTGVGIHQVKEALEASQGDQKKAIVYLRKKGITKAEKRAEKATNNGIIGHYIHGKGIGVMVELQSETDFASSSDKFQELAKDLCMHIAAQSPEYVDRDSIPEDVLETEKQVYEKDLKGKPENIKDKILEGKLGKFYEEFVLLDQPFVKDDSKTINDLISEYIAALGEKIVVKRFVKFQVGNKPIIAVKS